ncbi:MAG: beta-mannosidase [Oscillospiraceae bacterium]|nr:beta-mannosidase [Oscillospiraceae bacterium]
MKGLKKKLGAALSAAAVACSAVYALPVTAETKDTTVRIEGEDLDGADLWTDIYQKEIPGFSGEGFTYLTNADLSFTMEVPADGMYSVVVHGAQILNQEGRYQTVEVNGSEYHTTVPYTEQWTDFDFGLVRLNKGKNEIKFINKYGYLVIDYVTVSQAEFPDLSTASAETCDPDATPETKALMKYLKSVYGKNMLSGQQQIYGGGNTVNTTIRYNAEKNICVDQDGVIYEFDEESKATADDGSTFVWTCRDADGREYNYNQQNRNYTYNNYENDVNVIYEMTGKYPAIQGFDFGSYCPCYAWDDGVVKRMIDWTVNKGGICTASWHVNVPTAMADYELGEPLDFSKTTYSEKTNFVTKNCMVEGTAEYDYFQLCMKNLAAELQKLQDAGVPVIFRPFHEAEGNPSSTSDPIDGSGAWFWWSKEGAVVYKELWAFLQDTLQNEYGLHNLIWEQNLYTWSEASAQWYSGDERVDIAAYDKYNVKYNRHDGKSSGPNLDAESGIFYKLVNFVEGNKMVAMAENDSIPSLNNLEVEHAFWLYFCPWYDSEQERFLTSDSYQDKDEVKQLYNSDFCITLDELPKDLFSSNGPAVTTTTAPSGTTVTTTGQGASSGLRGDVNTDDVVDVSDAVLLARFLAEDKEAAVSGQGMINADCDGSETLDAADVGIILSIIAKVL